MRLSQASGWSRNDIRDMTPTDFDAYLKLSGETPTTNELLKTLLR